MLIYKQLTKNKSVEIQPSFHSGLNWGSLGINFEYSQKCDHAGFNFDLNLIWFTLCIHFYDHRHWDYNKDDYVRF